MITPLKPNYLDKDAKNILIVDDNLEIHEDFKRILCPTNKDDSFDEEDAAFFGNETINQTRTTFNLDHASQGQEAIEKIQRAIDHGNRFAVVFMDIRMPPGLDGVETTQKIWEIDPDLQVVICTAYSDYSWDEMVASLGHTDKLLILRKPFDIIEVEQAAHTFSKKWALMQGSRQQSIFLEQTTDLAPSMIFWINQDGEIVYANKSASTLLDRTQEDLHATDIREIIPDWQGDQMQNIWIQTQNQHHITQEGTLLTKERQPIAAELIITSLDFYQSRLICLSAQDIRQRLDTLDQLEDARDAALEAVRMKSQFLAMMSHEIRTPMNGVVGIAEILAQTPLNESQREYVEIINQSGSALLSIINDILDSAKIESGKLDFKEINFDLHEIIKGSLQTVSQKALTNKVDLSESLSDDLPKILNGDPGRLRQALVNLLGNAVKFTQDGSVTISASVDTEETDHYRIHFSVKDTGIGMEPLSLERVFKPFTQADTTDTRRYGGTGLGLTITNQIIQAMGGEITVTSEPSKGSEFSFYVKLNKPTSDELPESKSTQVHVPTHTEEAKAPELSHNASHLRILLAEDNPVNQKVMQLQLKQMGQSVDIVDNGAKAVEAVRSKDYDVILMDCQMPVMDGFEATREIRKIQTKPIRIIAATANAMKEDRDRCIQAGMDDYLSKPITTDELAAALNADTSGKIPTHPKKEVASPPPDSIPIDEQRLHETTANDSDLRREIIKEYLLQAEEILTDMKAQIHAGEHSKVKKLAHKLAGSSATCGMSAIVPSLRTLESMHSSDHNQSITLHQEATQQLTRIRNYLTEKYS